MNLEWCFPLWNLQWGGSWWSAVYNVARFVVPMMVAFAAVWSNFQSRRYALIQIELRWLAMTSVVAAILQLPPILSFALCLN